MPYQHVPLRELILVNTGCSPRGCHSDRIVLHSPARSRSSYRPSLWTGYIRLLVSSGVPRSTCNYVVERCNSVPVVYCCEVRLVSVVVVIVLILVLLLMLVFQKMLPGYVYIPAAAARGCRTRTAVARFVCHSSRGVEYQHTGLQDISAAVSLVIAPSTNTRRS